MKRLCFLLIGSSLLVVNFYKSDIHPEYSLQREPLVLGAQMIFGFGTPTESPYPEMPYQMPRPKFYVVVAEPNGYCIAEGCGHVGERVMATGGWIQVYNTKFVETMEFFELENNEEQLKVIVSDRYGKVVGIHPNKGLNDVAALLSDLP